MKWGTFRKNYLKYRQNHEGYYTCDLCKKWIKEPELHHIKKRSVAPSQKFDPANIQLLCPDCHTGINPDFKKART